MQSKNVYNFTEKIVIQFRSFNNFVIQFNSIHDFVKFGVKDTQLTASHEF